MTSAAATNRGLTTVCNVFLRMMAVVGPWWALAIFPAAPAHAQTLSSSNSPAPTTIVVGFVGGFVRNDDDRHPEVQMIQRLSEMDAAEFHAMVFENRRRAKARKQILQWLDTDRDGHLSTQEKQSARIILFGHSWGGSAAIALARDLDRRGIPVLLTIQVDSVNKGWGHDDCVIPDNVAQAVNFYQTQGLLHGCPALQAADPDRTHIIGNYRFEYTAQPAPCRTYPWFDRHAFRTHNAMGCDPVVWAQVGEEIQKRLPGSIRLQEAQGPWIAGGAPGKQ
jgi:pimeloyl-ACP methyl ester carboxylesterase